MSVKAIHNDRASDIAAFEELLRLRTVDRLKASMAERIATTLGPQEAHPNLKGHPSLSGETHSRAPTPLDREFWMVALEKARRDEAARVLAARENEERVKIAVALERELNNRLGGVDFATAQRIKRMAKLAKQLQISRAADLEARAEIAQHADTVIEKRAIHGEHALTKALGERDERMKFLERLRLGLNQATKDQWELAMAKLFLTQEMIAAQINYAMGNRAYHSETRADAAMKALTDANGTGVRAPGKTKL